MDSGASTLAHEGGEAGTTAAAAAHRMRYELTGIVQGVGLRPALYRLARGAGLSGHVRNRAGSVRLVLEGAPDRIRAFMRALPAELPPQARLDGCVLLEDRRLAGAEAASGFAIEPSESSAPIEPSLPADLAICRDCRREIFDVSNRRFGYPFTTCTQCGPRYTVIDDMPYDRVRTTLSAFPLCRDCRREYADPGNRRFHAESIACPRCGPRLRLETAAGRRVAGDSLRRARAALADGAIVAVRGIGGFLFAVDACNRDALARLRLRKQRPHKPLAVMARTIAQVRRVCRCEPAAARLLLSAAAPIVILDVRRDVTRVSLPCDLLAPDTDTLGVMLPTSPLHMLLAAPLAGDPVPAFDWLVMTSGNRGGEPICIANDEARARLRSVADFMLLHDREINLRCDDSICALHRGRAQVWRRARGYAPAVLRIARPLPRCVLAMGAEMKNAIAVAFDDRVVFSPHIGDLESPEAVAGLRRVAEALPRFVGRGPGIVAIDLHPDMHSSRLGREIAARLAVPVVAVQHHHAHAAAALAEHGLREGLALVFDGTGLGTDGAIWGAELLDIGDGGWSRLASFAGVPLPGGDAAVRRPARQLVGRCCAAGLAVPAAWRARAGVSDDELRGWSRQCAAGVNAPVSHAAGRLFDAFASALGVAADVATYEGQTAVRLEAAARRHSPNAATPSLPFRACERDGMLWIDWAAALAALLENVGGRGCSAGESCAWAYALHAAVAAAALRMAAYGVERTGRRTIALSGGVFMNRILTGLLESRLESAGLRVLLHRDVPPNDGGIALGQAVVARC